MKTILVTVLLAISIVSCNHKTKDNDATETTSTSSELYACSMHPEVTGKKGDECSKCGMELTEPVLQKEKINNHNDDSHEHKDSTKSVEVKVEENKTVSQATVKPFSTSEIINNYLRLKNALTKDDTKTAATTSKALLKSFNNTDAFTIDPKLRTEFKDIIDDAKEHAKHIGDNANKIDHQREHFVTLSKDINDLIKLFGAKQKLYQDYCPMANNGKGAIWISEIKEIKNPYYGSEMLSCGSLKKTF